MQAVLPVTSLSRNHENTLPLGVEMALAKGKVIRIDSDDANGAIIRCLTGILWVTQEGLSEDVLLQPSNEYRSFSGGLIVLEALEPARIIRL